MGMNELIDPRRNLNLDSVQNLRDLGGYSTKERRKTKWGIFLRSGDMSAMTKDDQAALLRQGIRCVIDLRMAKEIAIAPNVFSDSKKVAFFNHDFWGTRFDDYRSKRKTATPEEKLSDLYCAGLEINGFVMAAVMKTLASSEGSFVFHCRSGKDRTGLVAALLLVIAGVPDEVVAKDFGLSTTYLNEPELTEDDLKKPGAYQKGSAPETMMLTLDFLRDRYGGVEGYLRDQGVSVSEIESVREKILGD